MAWTIDTIRALFTYSIALVTILGGGAAIVFLSHDAATNDTRVVIAGFVGYAIQFVFGQEISTRTARQAATFSGNGVHAAAQDGGV